MTRSQVPGLTVGRDIILPNPDPTCDPPLSLTTLPPTSAPALFPAAPAKPTPSKPASDVVDDLLAELKRTEAKEKQAYEASLAELKAKSGEHEELAPAAATASKAP